mmetsp:Transcript_122271/g.391166  ORF Transcript_122271/g.391166 Transcript_122271/m.391166 type:complete len:339 (+) Transcript_122271:4531-5547(+)
MPRQLPGWGTLQQCFQPPQGCWCRCSRPLNGLTEPEVLSARSCGLRGCGDGCCGCSARALADADVPHFASAGQSGSRDPIIRVLARSDSGRRDIELLLFVVLALRARRTRQKHLGGLLDCSAHLGWSILEWPNLVRRDGVDRLLRILLRLNTLRLRPPPRRAQRTQHCVAHQRPGLGLAVFEAHLLSQLHRDGGQEHEHHPRKHQPHEGQKLKGGPTHVVGVPVGVHVSDREAELAILIRDAVVDFPQQTVPLLGSPLEVVCDHGDAAPDLLHERIKRRASYHMAAHQRCRTEVRNGAGRQLRWQQAARNLVCAMEGVCGQRRGHTSLPRDEAAYKGS